MKNNYVAYVKNNNIQKPNITLDSNMVAYLYLFSTNQMTMQEYIRLKNALTEEQFYILSKLPADLDDIKFNTTPQVMQEIIACAKLKNDYGILHFLEKICKVKIPTTRQEKTKYAELIVDLMDEYLSKDIPLGNCVREYQSAIASEVKNDEENFADAKIVSENNVLNGKSPLVTRNEKHLISMAGFGRKNNLRSLAILEKNRKFLKSKQAVIPHKNIKASLKSDFSTTFRINQLPKLLDM